MNTYPTKQDKELIKGFSQLRNEKEIACFLRDLLTPAEIEEFEERVTREKRISSENKPVEKGTSKTPPVTDRLVEKPITPAE